MARPRLARLAARWNGSGLPRWTVRLRLTLVYGGLFLGSGIAVLAITYVLVQHDIRSDFLPTTGNGPSSIIPDDAAGNLAIGFAHVSRPAGRAVHVSISRKVSFPSNGAPSNSGSSSNQAVGGMVSPVKAAGGSFTVRVPLPSEAHGQPPTPAQIREQLSILTSEVQAEQGTELRQLFLDSGIALLVMAALSILLGWLVAGRALRPLRVIASKAQDISATNLHERIALQGPDDEMKRLGDTFDALLARLERAFDAQRQFVANASHELRTPLARQRTLLEVAAADPDADVASLRDASSKAISAGEEQERLIEALLTLASSERGLDERTAFDLAGVVGDVAESKRSDAAQRHVHVVASLSGAPTTGNPRLVERLVANLLDNALRYNDPGGWVAISTAAEEARAVVRVENTGQLVPEAETDRLFEPFQRLASHRTAREGLGLGLSIVRAVACAHGATVTATSQPAGGLDVRVAFPLGTDGADETPSNQPGG